MTMTTWWDEHCGWIDALDPDPSVSANKLSTRVRNGLANSGATCLADVAKLTRREFGRTKNVGKKVILEVEEVLADHGLAFKDDHRCPRCGYDPDKPLP